MAPRTPSHGRLRTLNREEPVHFLILLGGDTGGVAGVDLGLADPVAQRFSGDPELLADGHARRSQRAVVITVLLDHPHGPGFEVGAVGLLHDADPSSLEGGKKLMTVQSES